MSHQVFSNNAQNATLAAGIGATSANLTLTAGQGSLFPNVALNSNKFFTATLTSATNPNQAPEIIQCLARVGDDFTSLQRGQEGTPAQAWNAGDFVSMNPTAGSMALMVQPDVAQQQPWNFGGVDVGAANAYIVNLNPALTAHVEGMPIRFVAAHGNTGPSTFNDGVAAAALWLPDGELLQGGEIQPSMMCTVIFDGSRFILTEAMYVTLPILAAALATYATTAEVAAAIAAALLFAISQGLNGWIKIPTASGLPMIFQWGLWVGANAGAGLETISLNTTMPNFCLAAVCSSNRIVTGTVGTNFTANLTTTNFQAVLDRNAAGNRSGYWWTVGY